MTESDDELERAMEVQNLLRSATTASMATFRPDEKEPYCSLVLMATDMQANPLFLLSDLAIHTQNLKSNPRVSLLIAANSEGADPLTQARISVQGVVAPALDTHLQNRFLRRYPSTADYASFSDFNFYQLILERVHLVAGFGRINWVDKERLLNRALFLEKDEAETDVLEHMNTDHADAVQLLGGEDLNNWEMCGIDPEGADLRSDWHHKRILFEDSATNTDDIRTQLIQLVEKARN